MIRPKIRTPSLIVFAGVVFLSGCAGTPPASFSVQSGSAAVEIDPVGSCVLPPIAVDTPSTFPPADKPLPGQVVLTEQDAIDCALEDFAGSSDASRTAQLITYADWPVLDGGSEISSADQGRAAWVVGIDSAPTFPDLGPPGHTKIATTSYTVLLDGYTGQVVEFVASNILK